MTGKESVFTNPAQFNVLSTLPFTRTSGVGKIQLGGSIAQHPERARWEKELNRHYYACGCDTGAKGLLIGLIVGIIWAVYYYSREDWGIGAVAAVALSITIGGAIIGKVSGLILADRKLKQTVREIQTHWKPEVLAEAEREDFVCG